MNIMGRTILGVLTGTIIGACVGLLLSPPTSNTNRIDHIHRVTKLAPSHYMITYQDGNETRRLDIKGKMSLELVEEGYVWIEVGENNKSATIYINGWEIMKGGIAQRRGCHK